MVSNESRPQGTSISEQYGRPVTLEDIEHLMDKERVPRGTAYKIIAAIRAWSAWQQAKSARPWDFTQGGLSQIDNERTAERRKRVAERLLEEAAAKKAAQAAMLLEDTSTDAEIIELTVIPGQTIADAIAEFTREEPEEDPQMDPVPEPAPLPEPEVVLPAPEPVPAAPEQPPAPVVPEPEPEPVQALPEPRVTPSILTCRSCKRVLPAEAFGIDNSQASGRMTICRTCRSTVRNRLRLEKIRAREKREALEDSEQQAEKSHEAAMDARRAAVALALQAARLAAQAAAATSEDAAACSPAASAPPPGYKRCTACGGVKPHDDFQRNSSVKDGRRSQCKSCTKRQYRREAFRTRAFPVAGETKECRICGKIKRVPQDFYERTGRKVSNTCRDCEKEQARVRKAG